MIKSVLTFRRRKGMPVDEFQDYWLHEHPKAVLKLEGLQRYIQNHPLPQGYAKRDLPVDGRDHEAQHHQRGLAGTDRG